MLSRRETGQINVTLLHFFRFFRMATFWRNLGLTTQGAAYHYMILHKGYFAMIERD
jgi:hypothetical protein